MKQLVVITKAELAAAALTALLAKPGFRGKHCAEIAMVVDPKDVSPERQIRCEIVLFDTEQAARAYAQGDKQATDAVPTQPKGETPSGKNDSDTSGKA